MATRRPQACVLLIGNELLTGKIRDENGWYLTQVCRRRGIELREIAVVPDELDTIGSALMRLLRQAPLVFTSGGVGPTHDDLTMEAIARATDRELVRDPQMEALLREHYGESIGAALRMADIPTGTSLRALPGWPIMRLDLRAGQRFERFEPLPHDARIYILPGIPALLRAKVETLTTLDGELPSAGERALVEFQTRVDESELAPLLDAIVKACPEVEIGSYPSWHRGEDGKLEVTVKVTFESDTQAQAEAACARLRQSLAADPGA